MRTLFFRNYRLPATAKPESRYPETSALKSTRPKGAATLRNSQKDTLTLVSPQGCRQGVICSVAATYLAAVRSHNPGTGGHPGHSGKNVFPL